MANNKKITIQHLYATGTTETVNPSILELGEIAINATTNHEGIYFKNQDGELISTTQSQYDYAKIQHLDQDCRNTLTLNGVKVINHKGGVGEKTTSISSLTLNVDKWEQASTKVESALTTTNIDKWDGAADKIETFLKDAQLSGEVIDTLLEIQNILENTDGVTGSDSIFSRLNTLDAKVGEGYTKMVANDGNTYVSITDVIGSGFTKTVSGDGVSTSVRMSLTEKIREVEDDINSRNSNVLPNPAQEDLLLEHYDYVINTKPGLVYVPTYPLQNNDVDGVLGKLNFKNEDGGNINLLFAAPLKHTHSNYLSKDDLGGGENGLTISCGTWGNTTPVSE